MGSGAIAFDGVNGRMTFTALPLTNTFTVALWIYPVPNSASYGTLFAQDASKGIWYRGASRVIEFYGTSQTSQTAISENQWHHVAVVCNAGQVTYYLDGVADGTATGGIGFNADNMGDDPGSETFKGGVDEVRVYNGALSAAQVAALASPPPPAGLVAYLAAGGRLGLHDRRRLGRGPAGHAERRDRLDGGPGGQRGRCLRWGQWPHDLYGAAPDEHLHGGAVDLSGAELRQLRHALCARCEQRHLVSGREPGD